MDCRAAIQLGGVAISTADVYAIYVVLHAGHDRKKIRQDSVNSGTAFDVCTRVIYKTRISMDMVSAALLPSTESPVEYEAQIAPASCSRGSDGPSWQCHNTAIVRKMDG